MAAVADAVFKKSRRVAVVVMDFFRLGIVYPVAPGVDGATAIPKEANRQTNKKTAAQGAHRHLVVSGVAVWPLVGPRSTTIFGGAALEFTNTKFVPTLDLERKASNISLI
ncbi:MAG: hypothetical protein HC868_00010 [Sphingomonadales bacterium]|nr:hypothetical protein [Sphingomonadales bacterium]